MSSTKNLALLLFTCLVKEAIYHADAAPSVTTNELDELKRVTAAGHPASVVQIDRPLRALEFPTTARDDDDARRRRLADEPLAKGPLSGIIPGGGDEQTTAAPSTSTAATPGSSLPGAGYLSGGGGLPGGLPGVPGLSQGGDGGGSPNPTLILGGFSVLVVPMRGMNLGNMASMLSAGQQLGQMFPKPGGS